jgi:hypothetical protein
MLLTPSDSALVLSGDRLYIGDTFTLSFSLSVESMEPPFRPNLSQVNLRMIGKRNPGDPDEKALFDSARATDPYCTISTDPPVGNILNGRITINGAATANLKTFKPQPELASPAIQQAVLYFAFTALYQNETRRKVLETGEIVLRRDRIEDP